ncbi:phage head closure protein [Kaistia defluvii]|uniref:SPP1 family predicted phage head-tail adaptor n=1 Tax=Kaistia defluvii TaxID=410841 RepID=A0ABV2R2S2_9HYPH
MSMATGPLDRRITIERYVSARDALNNPVEAWSPLATVWASKTDVRDSEKFAAKENGASIETRFQIRWSTDVADVNPKDRINYGGRVFDIVGVKEIGRREGLEISATARAD